MTRLVGSTALFALCLGAACHRQIAAEAAPQVVFVCEHGAAKSVVATAYFNQLASQRRLAVRAIARGAAPQHELARSAVSGLASDGLAPDLKTPRPFTAGELRGSSVVVAFDCEKPAMRPLKGMGTCWNDVPVMSESYPRARDVIRARVAALVEQLVANEPR